jgi:drug/metabolite transporter (DMT)-like permease
LVSALLSRQKLLTRQLRNERWGSFFTATAGAVLITEFGSATAYTAHSSFVVLLALAAGIGFIGTSVLLSALRESARLSSAAAALPEGSSHDYDLSRAFLYLAVMTLCLSAFAGIL